MAVTRDEDQTVLVGSSGRYSLGESIGQGGAGAVYKAHDTQLNRWVAIKRLHPEGEEARERAGKIIHEARHLAAVSHPNIVTVYDFIEDQDDVLVVMELVKGRTLQEIVENAPLTIEDFVEIFRQTLEGLIAAHSLGMLHRDIKPSNIMVTDLPSGAFQVKVVDFGLAKISMEPSQQTIDQGGGLLGSVFTMAPEQFEGRRLDMRTDLYSLGCVAYFALTSYFPFTGDTVPEVICGHLQQRCTPLEQLRPDVPMTLCGWITRLMHVHPDERPDSSSQALLELQAALDPDGMLAFSDTLPTEEDEATMLATPVVRPESAPATDAPKPGTGPVKPPVSLMRSGAAGIKPLTTRVVRPGTALIHPSAAEVPAPTAAPAAPAAPAKPAIRNVTANVPVSHLPTDPGAQRRRRLQLAVMAVGLIGICVLLWPKHGSASAGGTPIAVADQSALIAANGQSVVLEGQVASVQKSADGAQFEVSFEGADTTKVILPATWTDEQVASIIGTKIRVKGMVSVVDNVPQVMVANVADVEKL